MASKECKIALRVGFVILLLLILFFIGRPVFWKLSAILHDKETLTLGINIISISSLIPLNLPTLLYHAFVCCFHSAQQGISDVLMETRKKVGLYNTNLESFNATNRRLLRYQVL